jgi:hypothetical protein
MILNAQRSAAILIPVQKVRKRRDENTFAKLKPPEGQVYSSQFKKSEKKGMSILLRSKSSRRDKHIPIPRKIAFRLFELEWV